MKMRCMILGCCTAFVFWPVFAIFLWMFGLSFHPPGEMHMFIVWFVLLSLLGLLLSCALGVEEHPILVKRVLLLLFFLALMTLPMLALPTIT